MRALFLMLALGWSVVAAAALPEGVEPAQWDALLAKIVAEGKPMDSGVGIYLSLERIEPDDRQATHQADYISAVGGYAPDGQFQATHLEAVFETWTKLEDGNWAIDQWLFPASLAGDLKRSYHVKILEAPGGSIIEHKLTVLGDEEAGREWSPRLRSWL